MAQGDNFQDVRWPIPLTHEPSRSLSEEEFEWALVAGLGRAMTAWSGQEHELRRVLLAAALRTPSIDPQVDSRHSWIATMIEMASEPAFYVDRVLDAGVELEPFGHSRDSHHRIGIIKHFARQGEFGCREWMLGNLVDGRLEVDWIETVGWEGIVEVARARGASGELDAEVDALFRAYRYATDEASETVVRTRLQKEASTDVDVAAYLRALEDGLRRSRATSSGAARHDRFDFSHIDPGLKGPRLRPWFESATNAQLEQVLRWVERDDSDERRRLIASWKNFGPPLHRFSNTLFQWSAATLAQDAAATIQPDKLLAAHSTGLLGTLSDPRVRRLGIARIESGDVEGGFALLRGNWRSEDAQLLVRALPLEIPVTPERREEHHSLALTVNDLVTALGDDGLIPAARWVYLSNPCAHCRSKSVDWLRDRGALDSALAAEFENDVWNHEDPFE